MDARETKRSWRWLPFALGLLGGAALSPHVPRAETVRAEDFSPPEVMSRVFAGQRWVDAPTSADEADAAPGEALEALAAIGYAAGSRLARDDVGVRAYAPALAQPGVNLATFGHEPAAILFDMDGRVLHRWAFDVEPTLGPDETLRHRYWRRVRAAPDGELLAIHEGQYLLALDVDSNLLWRHARGAHHDLDVADDGTVFVLTREARAIPRIHRTRPCLEDFVTELAPDGTERRRVSLLRAFERSDYAPLLDRLPADGDITHANTLELLDGRLADRIPAFAAGRILVSLREIDTIAVVDLDAQRVAWALTGLWRAQHQPTVLDDGRLLLFDNQGVPGHSRVLEFDLPAQRVVWSYGGGDVSPPFYSAECGTAARLENGNTLITETDAGRAFEVTPDGTIVWEYVSPYRTGERDQYLSSLFEVVRLPSDFGAAWRTAHDDAVDVADSRARAGR